MTKRRWDRVLTESLVLAVLVFALVPAGLTQQGAYTSYLDLEYAYINGTSLKLDLHVPNSEGPFPVIVWVHGGGWQTGDKSDPNPAIREASRGYAVVSINYRLQVLRPAPLDPNLTFPVQIQDCKAAVRWLRANAALYNLDANRIGAWGESAGGHLASLLGTTAGVSDLEDLSEGNPTFSSRVSAVVDWYGPTDFLQMDAQTPPECEQPICHSCADSPESYLIGCAIQTCPVLTARANPINYITADDAAFLIMHGTADCEVPPGQSQLLYNALHIAGLDSTLTYVQGAGHGTPTPTPTPTPIPTPVLPSGQLTRVAVPLVPIGANTVPPTIYDYQKTGPRVVLKLGPNDYRMWYEGVYAPNTANCVYATSADGINWTKYGVVAAPAGGSELEVSPHTIIYEDSIFKMWYHAYDGIRGKRRIKYAESPDGINWTKLGVALDVGPQGSIDDQMACEPRVFHLEDGTYRMYYAAQNENRQGVGVFPLTYATSSDGLNWIKSGRIIFPEHDSGYGIVRDGSMWYMWYGNPPYDERSSIGFAYSFDGLNWIDGPNNPVLTVNSDKNTNDGAGLGDSVSAYRDDNQWRILYTGLHYSNGLWWPEAICLATIAVPEAIPTSTDLRP